MSNRPGIRRYGRWHRTAEVALPRIDRMLIQPFFLCGKLDAATVEKEEKYIGSDGSDDLMLDAVDTGHLWLLATYEAFRTLDGILRQSGSRHQGILASKQALADLRIPFTKLSPVKKGDYRWPIIAVGDDHILGWAVGPQKWVSRRGLADQCLEAFEQLASGE